MESYLQFNHNFYYIFAKHIVILLIEELCARLEEEANLAAEARACTGVLGIHPMAKDIKIDNFSVTFHGAELIVDSKVELSCGQKYGLLGVNGSGKSSFLAVLGNTFYLTGLWDNSKVYPGLFGSGSYAKNNFHSLR